VCVCVCISNVFIWISFSRWLASSFCLSLPLPLSYSLSNTIAKCRYFRNYDNLVLMIRENFRNSSWIPQFKNDVKETKFYALTLWFKLTQNSYGMPRFFFPYFRLMSRLSRPFSFLEVAELKPTIEDHIIFLDNHFGKIFVRYTGVVDYKDWTMFYVSFEMKNNKWIKCATINSFPSTCHESTITASQASLQSPLDVLPEEMVESIDVNTEVKIYVYK